MIVNQSDLFGTFNELWAIFPSWQIGFFSAVFSLQKNEHMMYRLVHVYPWGCMVRYVTDSFFFDCICLVFSLGLIVCLTAGFTKMHTLCLLFYCFLYDRNNCTINQREQIPRNPDESNNIEWNSHNHHNTDQHSHPTQPAELIPLQPPQPSN